MYLVREVLENRHYPACAFPLLEGQETIASRVSATMGWDRHKYHRAKATSYCDKERKMLLVETAFIPEHATSPHLEMVVLDMSYPRIGLTSHPAKDAQSHRAYRALSEPTATASIPCSAT